MIAKRWMQFFKFELSSKSYKILMLTCLVYAFVIRIFQYLNHRNLWLDESYLALAIRDKSFTELLNPLDYGQVAPIGFVYLTKIIITIFGANEYSLRFLPLLASLASVIVFFKLCNKFLLPPIAVLASFVFAASPYLIYYSQELKQYSNDVFFVLFIFYLYLKIDEKNNMKSNAFLLTGSVATFFSHASIFALASIATHYFLRKIKERTHKEIVDGVVYGLIFGAAFLINYFLFIRTNATNDYMTSYWLKYFLPLPNSLDHIKLWIKSFTNFYSYCGFSLLISPLIGLLCVYGWRRNFLNQSTLLQLCLLAFLFLIIASVFGHYPFFKRLILFAVPFFYLIVFLGTNFFYKKHKTLGLIALSIILFSFSFNLIHNARPIKKQEVTPLIAYLNKHIQKQDKVYIYYGAIPAIKFYLGPDVANNSQYILGIKSRGNNSQYLKDIHRFANYDRVWILFSHSHADEREFFINHFPMPIIDTQSEHGTYLYLISKPN